MAVRRPRRRGKGLWVPDVSYHCVTALVKLVIHFGPKTATQPATSLLIMLL